MTKTTVTYRVSSKRKRAKIWRPYSDRFESKKRAKQYVDHLNSLAWWHEFEARAERVITTITEEVEVL